MNMLIHVVIIAVPAGLGLGILAALWRTRSNARHGVRAATSHRHPRTQTLGGAIEAILRRSRERDPGPVPAAMYPPIGASNEIWAAFMRTEITPRIGVSSPMDNTSEWPAIRDDDEPGVYEEVSHEERAGLGNADPAPEPVFAM